MEPDAPMLLPSLRNKEDGPDQPTNVAASSCNSSAAMSQRASVPADYVVEREFNTAMVHQGYIEPHNAVGIYNSDGHATIYCSTQGTFDVRSMSAAVLGVPWAKSGSCRLKSAAASAARPRSISSRCRCCCRKKTGHPVKLVMSRAKCCARAVRPRARRSGARWDATSDGKITAAEVWMAYEAGALSGLAGGRGRDVSC